MRVGLSALALSTLIQRSSSFPQITRRNMSKRPRDSLAEVDQVGRFLRKESSFREWISSTHPEYKPEADRYHLYLAGACPWANRCLSMLYMKGLDHVISHTLVHPTWQKTKPNDEEDVHCGWVFFDSDKDAPLQSTAGHGRFAIGKCQPDLLNGAKAVRDLYEMSNDTSNKYTVPILWDKKTKKIINNESSEILRMLNSEFNQFAKGPMKDHDFYPENLRAAIDEMNAFIYPQINNGVYRCGFAKSQEAYDEAIADLNAGLIKLDHILSKSRYLTGSEVTEADIRLFQTLVRYDEVYVVYFKTNTHLIRDFNSLRNYCRDIYQLPGMKESIYMDHIKMHYFTAHPTLNPYSVIPKGPNVLGDLEKPHNRDPGKGMSRYHKNSYSITDDNTHRGEHLKELEK